MDIGQLKNFSPRRVSAIIDLAMFFGKLEDRYLTYNDKYQLERFGVFLRIARDWRASSERRIVGEVDVQEFIDCLDNIYERVDEVQCWELKAFLQFLARYYSDVVLIDL